MRGNWWRKLARHCTWLGDTPVIYPGVGIIDIWQSQSLMVPTIGLYFLNMKTCKLHTAGSQDQTWVADFYQLHCCITPVRFQIHFINSDWQLFFIGLPNPFWWYSGDCHCDCTRVYFVSLPDMVLSQTMVNVILIHQQ